jgi:hypothetical protein
LRKAFHSQQILCSSVQHANQYGKMIWLDDEVLGRHLQQVPMVSSCRTYRAPESLSLASFTAISINNTSSLSSHHFQLAKTTSAYMTTKCCRSLTLQVLRHCLRRTRQQGFTLFGITDPGASAMLDQCPNAPIPLLMIVQVGRPSRRARWVSWVSCTTE